MDTGAKKSVVSENFLNSLPQTLTLSKVHTHKVASARGANLGMVDSFIVLQDLQRYLILGLN